MSNEFGEVNAFDGAPDDGSFSLPDMSNAESPWKVKAGDYIGTITSFTQTTTKESGNPMFVFKIDCEVGRAKPMNVYYNIVNVPSNMVRIKMTFVDVFGFPSKGGSFTNAADKIVGQRCMVTLVDGEWKGESRSEVARINKLPANAATFEDDQIPF